MLTDGTEDERFQFLTNLQMENRKAFFEVYKENQNLRDHVTKRDQIEGAAREMRMIHKIDSDFPDPEQDPDGAWRELNKQDGLLEWIRETGINGNINRIYKLYLADKGKEVSNRKPKVTEETKKQPPQKSPESVMGKIATDMGTVSGGGAVVGRDADDAEIRQSIKRDGIGVARQKYGDERALELFREARGLKKLQR